MEHWQIYVAVFLFTTGLVGLVSDPRTFAWVYGVVSLLSLAMLDYRWLTGGLSHVPTWMLYVVYAANLAAVAFLAWVAMSFSRAYKVLAHYAEHESD